MNSRTSLQGQLINTTGCLLCRFTALKSRFLGQFMILTVVFFPSDRIQAASYMTAAPTVTPQGYACFFLHFKYLLLSFFFNLITGHITVSLLTSVTAHFPHSVQANNS